MMASVTLYTWPLYHLVRLAVNETSVPVPANGTIANDTLQMVSMLSMTESSSPLHRISRFIHLSLSNGNFSLVGIPYKLIGIHVFPSSL